MPFIHQPKHSPVHAAADQPYGTKLMYLLGSPEGAHVDLNEADETGMTPLLLAAQHGNLHGLLLLIAAGADLNAQDADGWNALHHAVFNGRTQIAQTLLDYERVPHSLPAKESQSTPLHLAVARQNFEMIDLLLSYGASKSFTDAYGRTPADIASQLKLKELAKKLAV